MQIVTPPEIEAAFRQAGWTGPFMELAFTMIAAELNTIYDGCCSGLAEYRGGWPLQVAARHRLTLEPQNTLPLSTRVLLTFEFALISNFYISSLALNDLIQPDPENLKVPTHA